MGISGTDRAPLYALAGIARAGATRAGCHSPKLCIQVGGVERGWARAVDTAEIESTSLTITDIQGEAPSRASFLARSWTPELGMEVIIRLGSTRNTRRLFAGTILSVVQGYVGTPANQQWWATCTDWTLGLNRRKVSGHFTGSATTIAQTLISTYATGYTSTHIEAGMSTVDGGITFTMQDLTDCLTQLFKRIGGGWYCDYDKDVHAWETTDPASLTNPTALTAAHLSLSDFSVTRDISQVVTRVFVEGGGGSALSGCAAGETIVPVNEPEWYSATGGVVKSGPQRIAYAGVDVGGGGGLVGPGASPTSAPAVTLADGAGVESGAHDYAVTYVTASGESIRGPLASITTGNLAAPGAAPVATSAAGTGVESGTHDYAVTYVTASGETTASPVDAVTVGGAADPAPTTAPDAAVATVGAGVTAGAHTYAVSFVTGSGETGVGPTVARSTSETSAPTSAPTAAVATVGTGVTAGAHTYAVSFVTGSGETVVGPTVARSTTNDVVSPPPAGWDGTRVSGGSIEAGNHTWGFTFVTAAGETTCDVVNTIAMYAPYGTINLFNIPVGPAGVTARRVYRSAVGTTDPVKYVGVINDNTTTTFSDSIADASLGSNSPASNTATVLKAIIPLSSIPVGAVGSGVTSRKVYRSAAGTTTPLKLLTTLSNNTTTTYDDSTADASLGSNSPASSTAVLQHIALSSIPVGAAGTGVTQRKIYRSAAGTTTPLKLLTTLSNNTTTTYDDTTADASLGGNAPSGSTLNRVAVTSIPIGVAAVTSRKLYRTVAAGAQLKWLATIANNTTTTYDDTTADASLGANVPTSNTATLNQVAISSVPVGGATVTARKVYRTAAGGSQLKLQQTIADNTTTTGVTDATADAALGANVPTSDASGLTQPTGQVIAGSTSLIVAGTSAFLATGGWAVIGNGQQVIRYTGKSGTALTGVPATGDGAIVAAVGYNSTVTAAPQLTGIPASGTGAILYAILRGDDVNILVQRDDVPAQTALAAVLGGDGICEDYIQDRRLAQTECETRGDAQLAFRGYPDTTAHYRSRDINTRAGRPIVVALVAPTSVDDTFLIQSVSITNFVPAIMPNFDVVAGNDLYTFEDLLRRARKE